MINMLEPEDKNESVAKYYLEISEYNLDLAY
jgi:hypothetical protein